MDTQFGALNDSIPVWLIPLIPLTAAVALLLGGKRWREPFAGWFASLAVVASFGVSVVMLLNFLGRESDTALVNRLYQWIPVGDFTVDVAYRVDALSLVMALTVTGVGAIIHVYSIDYMHRAPTNGRYFGYMNLFVFFMLTLVLADNFLLLFVGWEGVGLCSYLLIGFWYERKKAADAAKKAFIVTRVGDAAFLIGIISIWFHFGSLDYDAVFVVADLVPAGTATVVALLLFAGAVGKSAQLPLHTWLPDAMEGPTPVSALIHAATMVTAGVYLVVRAHPIFEASGAALTVVAVVGIGTAIYAGLAALAQDDIKRMLAYSTISQLGFMFFGAGVGAYAAAVFLLVTHAFFKAMLFLAAGSLMHGLDGETDMMRMGALRKAMPITSAVWLVGWLAMSGIPPFSGFFSKDQVVAAASEAGRVGLWVLALVGALLTAIYMTRATFMVFFGRSRSEVAPLEAPPLMRVSLVLLGILATAGGVLGLSATTGILPTFLEPVFGAVHTEEHVGPSGLILTVISVVVALVGIGIAYLIYGSGRVDWMSIRARFAGPKRALERGLFVDDLYGAAIVLPGKAASAFAAYVFDKRVIDGAINGLGSAIRRLAAVGRRLQSGLVRTYAVAFLLGVVGILWYVTARS